MQVHERQMRTNRSAAAWLEAGSGWPVILLHAFPLNATMWRPQLERVPKGWRFIAPDFRGCGRSGPVSAPWSIDDYAADIGDLMDCLQLDDAVIAGLSMGGYVAFAMYRQAPARFNGLVLADTRSQADTPELRAVRARLREVLATEGPRAIADQMLPKQLSAHADAALVEQVRRTIESADPAGIDAALAAMMDRPDSTPDLPHIGCATLVVAGELDPVTPVADSQAMQRLIPRSTITVIPAASHLSNLEQPDLFSTVLADFLLERL